MAHKAGAGAVSFLVVHVCIIHPLIIVGGAVPPILAIIVPQGVVGVVVWLSSVPPHDQPHVAVVLCACCHQ